MKIILHDGGARHMFHVLFSAPSIMTCHTPFKDSKLAKFKKAGGVQVVISFVPCQRHSKYDVLGKLSDNQRKKIEACAQKMIRSLLKKKKAVLTKRPPNPSFDLFSFPYTKMRKFVSFPIGERTLVREDVYAIVGTYGILK